MIYCIGDSHSAFFSGQEKMQPCWPEFSKDIIPYFKTYRIGPATAYQLSRKKTIIKNILQTINFKESDKIMFCFGEVDIRAHLVKHYLLTDESIEDIVKNCVSRYIKSILFYKKYKIDLIVWGPIASWNDKKLYKGPSFGTNIFRNQVTRIFNDFLKEECKINNLIYVSFFESMLNQDYTTNVDFLDDWEDSHIHLSQNAMPSVIKLFKNNKIINND
jgi:hypothetical protein